MLADFPAYWVAKRAHDLVVLHVAHHPAQHVHDHRALVGDQRLELRREHVEFVGARKRHRVVGQRAHRHILHGFVESHRAGSLLHVHGFRIAREAVAQPPVFLGRGTDRTSPPLVRDGVGEQAVVGFLADGAACHSGHFRRPGRGHGVVGQLNHAQRRRRQRSERRDVVRKFFQSGVGVGRGQLLVHRLEDTRAGQRPRLRSSFPGKLPR